MNGEREELVKKLPPNTPGGKEGVTFGSDRKEINIFACPDHKKTIKATGEAVDDTPGVMPLHDYGLESNGETETDETETDGDVEYAESKAIKVRNDLEVEGNGTCSVWNTNMDIKNRDLRGLAYQYRYRWRVETAIRQLKDDFTGRCGSDDSRVRAFYLGTGQLLFNFWVALNHELPYQFDHSGVRVTGIELLHGIREADFEAAKPRKHP